MMFRFRPVASLVVPRTISSRSSLRQLSTVVSSSSCAGSNKKTEEGKSSSRGSWWKIAAAGSLIAGGLAVFGISTVHSKEATPSPPADAKHAVTLFQYQVCPFCNKVRALLDFARVPYSVVEVNPLTKKEIAFSKYKKVPIVHLDGEQLENSSDIMRSMRTKLNLPGPSSLAEEEEEKMWLDWVDAHFVHLLSPNIYRTPQETLQAFDYLFHSCGEWSTWETLAAKYVGSVVMFAVGKRLKAKHHIDDERRALYDACNVWSAAVGTRQMMGGSTPNLADLAVFGVLRAIHEMDTFRDVAAHTAIMPWYQKVASAVGPSQQINSKKE